METNDKDVRKKKKETTKGKAETTEQTRES